MWENIHSCVMKVGGIMNDSDFGEWGGRGAEAVYVDARHQRLCCFLNTFFELMHSYCHLLKMLGAQC